MFGRLFFLSCFSVDIALGVNTLQLLPRTKNCILLSSFQVQVNAIVLISNPRNPVHSKKVACYFCLLFFSETFIGLTDKINFYAFQKLSKALKFPSSRW